MRAEELGHAFPPLSSTEPHVYATNTPPRQSARRRNRVGNGEEDRRAGAGRATYEARYSSQPGSSRPSVRWNPSRGAYGCRNSENPASWGVRSSFLALHFRQEATTFSHVCSPPRERGITWSRFSAAAPQY